MNKKEQLHAEILRKVKDYYQEAFPAQPFVAGKTRVNYGGRHFDEKELINLVDSSLEFWLTSGRYVKQFEERLSKFIGVKHTILTNSGSSANLLAFMALTQEELGERRIKRGDEVITVAAGFPTTVAPILQYGAVPVFVDVELETYNLDCSQLENALSPKTKAIMIAHTLGNPFNVEKIKQFCQTNNLWLIEDNCDALGSKYRMQNPSVPNVTSPFDKGEFSDKSPLSKGVGGIDFQYTGTFGDIATCSFYPPHHMTMGEGGALLTNNPLLKKLILSLRDWGRDCICESGQDNLCNNRFSKQYGELPYGYDHKYVYSRFGYNLKVTDMQAAVGCAQLDKLPTFIERRKENHAYLLTGLKSLEDKFILPYATKDSEPSWFGFMLTVKENTGFSREAIVNHLEKNNIQTRMLFAGNLLKHPCFASLVKDLDYRVIGDLSATDTIMNHTFWVGVYPGMTKDKLDYIISSINLFLLEKKH